MSLQSNSQVFLDDLNSLGAAYLALSNTPAGPGRNVMLNQFLFGTTTLATLPRINAGLLTMNPSNTKDAKSFIENFYTTILRYPSVNDIPPEAFDPTNPQGLLSGCFNAYKFIIGADDPTNTDLNIINTPNLPAQFNALFTDFIKNFNYSVYSDRDDGTLPPIERINGILMQIGLNANYPNFFTSFLNYLRTTAVVQDSTSSLITLPNFTNFAGVNYVQSFQKIYESFNGPVGTLSTNSASWTVAQRVFVQRLTDFYNSELQKSATPENPEGFFATSQSLGDWFNFSQNLYYNPNFNPASIVADPKSTIILNQVLLALISMIGTIQTVAAAQANSLNFLSQWQQSYTNKLNQIHTFAAGDGTVIGTFTLGNDAWDQNGAQAVRNALNNVNQSYISKLQANQQTISDQAKSLQSNVNQSNDAANQQGSIADSVLQELSTILSAIFR